jgi:NADPH:quinone reductase-like Zn-dependent oxidoreductase
MGLVGGGGQAEAVVVRQEEALPLSAGLSHAEGAAIPEVFYTAYDALVTRGRLAAGERVLIHAVGSGVGTAAAQIAKHLGATVIGTSRSAAKLARAQTYGVDVGIDTSRTAFQDAVGDLVHVVLDVLGAGALAANLAVLGRRGEIDLDVVLRKRLEIIGSVMRSRGPEERAAVTAEIAERVLPLFESRDGRAPVLRPVLERVYPMERLAEAHEVMERNENFGKLVGEWSEK